MKHPAIWPLLLSCLLLGCRPDEGPTISFPECEGNDTYGLDAFVFSTGPSMWSSLSKADGTVVHEEEALGVFGTPVFVNKESACEDIYDLTIGRLEQNNFGAGISRSLYMDQVANLPDGTGVTMFRSFARTFLTFYKQDEVIQITHCPPIDSLYLPYAAEQFGIDASLSYSYSSSDSTLTIITQQGYTSSMDGLLGLRSTHNQAWQGRLIDLSTFLANEYDFRDLSPLTVGNLHVQTEDEVSLLELHLVTNESNLRTALIGTVKTDEIAYLIPPGGLPFQLEVITSSPTQDYELKRRYAELPAEIDLRNPLITISNLSMDRPTISFNASGADIVRLTSDPDNNFSGNDYIYHTYTTSATEGQQSIRLPDLTPSLADNFTTATDCYNSSLDNGLLELLHYPGINGDYRTFLRKIIGSALTQDQLLREEYEKLRVKL